MHANQRDKFQRSKRQRECDVDLAESEESEQEEFEEDEMIELAEDLKEEFAFGKFRDPKRKGPDTTLTRNITIFSSFLKWVETFQI